MFNSIIIDISQSGEMVDTQCSERCSRKRVWVQVPPLAPDDLMSIANLVSWSVIGAIATNYHQITYFSK